MSSINSCTLLIFIFKHILLIIIIIAIKSSMNRIIRYFSVLNKIKAKQSLRQGNNFPRSPSHIIPHTPSLDALTQVNPIHLSPYQQYLIDNHAMERPFTGKLWHELSVGFYNCLICDTRLFTYNHKFQPNTGYASFWGALDGTITTKDQEVLFDEVNQMRAKYKSNNPTYKRCLCTKCGTHLGAVFFDGPPPTFLRYSINSVMLRFYEMPDFVNPHIKRKEIRNQRKLRRITYLR